MATYPEYGGQIMSETAQTRQACYDGESAWILSSVNNFNKTVTRYRASDMAYLKSDKTVGTYAQAVYNTAPAFGSNICTDGTYFWIGTSSLDYGIYQFRCSDGVYVGAWGGAWVMDGVKSIYAAGYAFIPSLTNGSISKLNAGGNYSSSGRVFSGANRIDFDGTDLWVSSVSNGLKKITTSFGLLATYFAGETVQCVEVAGANLWVSHGAANKLTRIRISDGAWIAADGSVSATEVAYSPGDCTYIQSMHWDGTDLWLSPSSSASSVYRLTRLRGTDGVPIEVIDTPSWRSGELLRIGNYLWMIPRDAAYNPSLPWRYEILATGPAAPVNLTAVAPGVGPHLSLTFDNPVGITGPTIGPASSGLGVTGVTSISTTQIDLACAIRPDHPDGQADTHTLAPPIGEADNLGPPIPTGIGAVII
jgi:hypothetical protein